MVTATADKRDVIDRINDRTAELRALGVQRLSLFGSFVRNSPRADSDVDFLLEFRPGRKSYDNFIAVCELLEESLCRRVEVLTPESLSPHIGPNILQEAEDVFVAE